MSFLSTPSARRATRFPAAPDDSIVISIHALREEGDVRTRSRCLHQMYFYPRPPRGGRLPGAAPADGRQNISIHALREEGDRFALPFRFPPIKFLSTPSARRATKRLEGLTPIQKISIHALREEGDEPCVGHQQPSAISTHALREEGDQSVGHSLP